MENKDLRVQFIENLALALKYKVNAKVDDLTLKLNIKEKTFLSSTILLQFYDDEIKSIVRKVDDCLPEVTEYFGYFLHNVDDHQIDYNFQRFLVKNYQDVIESCFDKFDKSGFPSSSEVVSLFNDDLFILELNSNSLLNNFIEFSSSAIFKHVLDDKYEALAIKIRNKKKQLDTPMVFEKVEPDLSIGLDEITNFKRDILHIIKTFDSQGLDKLELARKHFINSFAAEPYVKIPHITKLNENTEILILCIQNLMSDCEMESHYIQQMAVQLMMILDNKNVFDRKDFSDIEDKVISSSINKTLEIYLDNKSQKNKEILGNLDFLKKSSRAKYLDGKFDLASLHQASFNPEIILHHNIIDAKTRWNMLEKEILSSEALLNTDLITLLIEQFKASEAESNEQQKKVLNIYIEGFKSLKKRIKTIHKIKSEKDTKITSKSSLDKFLFNIDITQENGREVNHFELNPFDYYYEVNSLYLNCKNYISAEVRKIDSLLDRLLYLDELLIIIEKIRTAEKSDLPDSFEYLKPFNLTFEELMASTDKRISIVYEIGLSLNQINLHYTDRKENDRVFEQKATFVRLVPYHFKSKMIEFITALKDKVEQDINVRKPDVSSALPSNEIKETNNVNYESYEFFKKWFHYPLEYSPLGYYHQWQDNLKHLKSEIENNLLSLDTTKSNIYLSKLSRELIDIQKKSNTNIEVVNAWYDKYNTNEEDLVKNYDYKNTLHKILNNEPINDRNAYDEDLHPDTDRLQWDFYDYHYRQIIEEALNFIGEVKMDLGIITTTTDKFQDSKTNESNQKSDSVINDDHKNISSLVDEPGITKEVFKLLEKDQSAIIAALNYLNITENGTYVLTEKKRSSIRAVLDTLISNSKITDYPITKLCIYVSDLIGAGLQSLPDKGNTYNDYQAKTIEYLKYIKP